MVRSSKHTFLAISISILVGLAVGVAIVCGDLGWTYRGGVRQYLNSGNGIHLVGRAFQAAEMWIAFTGILHLLWALTFEGLLGGLRFGWDGQTRNRIILAAAVLAIGLVLVGRELRPMELMALFAGGACQALFLAKCRPGRT